MSKSREIIKRISVLFLSVIMVLTCFSHVSFAGGNTSSAESRKGVTVYVTVSNDGDFVKGKDKGQTVMARVPVTVEYFDLADYGLEEFYRYEAASYEDGGEYISTNLVEKPTLLHLYIKILEKYYLGGETLKVGDSKQDALSISGSPTSFYMKRFWGHDENLMYYVDHAYPLMRDGWGSTADYILLEDGMEIDLAMFTDWSFYHTGAFAFFDPTEKTVSTGEEVSLTMMATATNAATDGTSSFSGVPVAGEPIRVSIDGGKTWQKDYAVTDSNGKVRLSFSKAGTYLISGGPLFVNYPSESGKPDVAPPVATVTVKGEPNPQPTTPTKPVPYKQKAAPTKFKTKALKKRAKLSWKKSSGIGKYQVAYKEKGQKKWKYKTISSKKNTITIKKLKAKQKYVFKVRSYNIVEGKKINSKWSKTKTVRIKE